MSEQRAWVFDSSISDPEGVRVDVTITLPASVLWKDAAELAEVAQMTASRAMGQAVTIRERPPF